MTQQELDFRKVFESLPGLFVVLRPDFTIVALSDTYVLTAQLTRAGMIGRKFFDVFMANPSNPGVLSREALRVSFEKVLRTGKSDVMPPMKYELPKPECEGGGFELKFWGAINAPVVGSNGEVEYIIRRVEDITQLVSEQGEHAELQQQHDIFFEHSHDLLAVVGTDGKFKRVNPSFERVLGYTSEDLCTKLVTNFLHPDDVVNTNRRIQIMASGTSMIESINRFRSKNGTYRTISWNTTPIGQLLYTVGRDITAQVNAEERMRSELRGSEAQILQLQKMDAIGRLAGGIAHDFNNMLGAVSMSCDSLIDQSEKPEVVRQKVEDLREVTARAAALTRQLLVFSRKQVVELKAVSINLILQQLEKMLARLIGEHIKIITKFVLDLKAVSIDATQLEQVVLNLVVNARDAMPSGGTITIETSNIYLDQEFTRKHFSVGEGHYVLLSIADTGIGMDAATRAKIFEPFFTTKPVGQGTGLGLTTTYGIIKQAKGTIWVYSELGKGTIFKVYLPITDKSLETQEAPKLKISKTKTGHTILLVEDDEMLREGFIEMLERRGFTVVAAANGKEAIEMCQAHKGNIDLLLTDMVMPGLTGIELAKKILALRKDLRVLYMSGYTSDVLENSGVESLNQVEFIQKPFDTTSLLTKVQELLRG